MKRSLLVKYGLIFSAIPLVSTYAIGHVLKAVFLPSIEGMTDINDPDRISVPIIEYVFPFAILSGAIAFCCWALLMRRSPSKGKALMAGLITVFFSYPILGFAIGFIYPDLGTRLRSGIAAAFSLAFFGNFVSFWLTYPLGAFLDRWIGSKYMESIKPRLMHEFD